MGDVSYSEGSLNMSDMLYLFIYYLFIYLLLLLLFVNVLK